MHANIRCLSCLFVFTCLLAATANSETVTSSGSLRPGQRPPAQGFDFVITDHFPGDVSPDGMDYQKLESVHVGQNFNIVVILINRGREEIVTSLGLRFYLDGKLYIDQTFYQSNPVPIPSNTPSPLWSQPLSFIAPGSHTYRWEIAVPEDVDPSNNVVSGTFEVLPAAGEVPTPVEITPTNTPTKGAIEPPAPPTPTPPTNQDGFVVIERLYLVLDDGDSDSSNDVEVTEPEVGQRIRFCAEIRNPGTSPVTGYLYSVDLDDPARPSRQPGDNIAAGASVTLQSEPWTATAPGSRTVLWIFNEGRRSSPTDPSRYLEFTVVESNNTTPPTATPFPTRTGGNNSNSVEFERVFLVLNDGDDDLSNDVEIERPEVGQEIRFRADIRNTGTEDLSNYLYSTQVNGGYFLGRGQASRNFLAAGEVAQLQSEVWKSPTTAGNYTLTWTLSLSGRRPSSSDPTYEHHFTVIDPSGDITPTPSAIQTPTVEPTPTSTPTSETTPTASPTASPGSDSDVFEFDGGTLMDSGWAEIPGGFTNSTPGSVFQEDVAGMIPDSEDGRGLRVTVQEGQVSFLYGMTAIQTKNRPVLIRARVIADSPDAVIALVAFKGSITGQTLDGSMALNTSVSTADYMSQARDFVLVYQPSNGGEINLAFQVAAPPNAGLTTVYIDKIEYHILHADQPYFGSLFDFMPDESNRGRR